MNNDKMKITDKFKGVGIALITPMQENGSIDFAALARVIERVIEGGVDYLLALGTTSENPTLSADEREIGGLGIFITKKTMDAVSYAYENGENILTMTKKI
jgi:4-hydroxy-tetrahydrodipicolinate synthase